MFWFTITATHYRHGKASVTDRREFLAGCKQNAIVKAANYWQGRIEDGASLAAIESRPYAQHVARTLGFPE